jgi:hypothetical protein
MDQRSIRIQRLRRGVAGLQKNEHFADASGVFARRLRDTRMHRQQLQSPVRYEYAAS